MKSLNVFQLNISNILCFMCKCKQKLNLPVFVIFLFTEQEPNMDSEMKIMFKNLYVEQILISIAFHTVDPIFVENLNFKKNNF